MTPVQEDEPRAPTPTEAKRGHGRWMMIACCLPMLAIAIALAATGVVGYGFIGVAVACTAMMAAMMGAMSYGAGKPGDRR